MRNFAADFSQPRRFVQEVCVRKFKERHIVLRNSEDSEVKVLTK